MTFSREDERPKLTIRVDAELKAEVEQQDGTMSAFVRTAIRESLPDDDEKGITLPEEDDLAAAYQTLRYLADDGGWVPERVAVSQLAQKHSLEKMAARRHLIRRLDKRGYIRHQSTADGRFSAYHITTHE